MLFMGLPRFCMKRGYGSCPATCGELVQGCIGKKEYISSYCVDLYSSAMISEKKERKSRFYNRKSKSMQAVEYVFEHFNIDKGELNKLNLSIRSSIPVGKGMASSTADIGASIIAALDYLDKDMSAEEISKLVSRVEPTDSIFFPEVCIFDPINGEKREYLGYIDYKKVLVLEPDARINTVKIRKEKEYYKILKENKSITEKSFEMLSEGVKNKDRELIRKASENSALANEKIKETPYLRELIEIARKNDYGFLNISHTGTVVGIAIDEKTDLEKILYEIKKSDISNVYKKRYVRKIIKGGLRKEK